MEVTVWDGVSKRGLSKCSVVVTPSLDTTSVGRTRSVMVGDDSQGGEALMVKRMAKVSNQCLEIENK